MPQGCEAVILRTYPFGEANKVVLALTRQTGLLRGVAYGAKKSKGRFGASLEPLTLVRMTYKIRENQELAVVENCEIIRALPGFQLSWEQNLHVSYFAELLGEFAREQVEGERLFRLTLAAIDALTSVPILVLARYLEFWVLRLEGVLPSLDTILPEQLAEKAASMLRLPPAELGSVQFNSVELGRLETATDKLIEYHLEKRLKAKTMLKDLLEK